MVIVTGSVTVMPNIRTSASATVPTPIGPSVRTRSPRISVIQRGWLGRSAMTSQTCWIGASMTTSELIGSGCSPFDCSARIRSSA